MVKYDQVSQLNLVKNRSKTYIYIEPLTVYVYVWKRMFLTSLLETYTFTYINIHVPTCAYICVKLTPSTCPAFRRQSLI